MMIFIFWLEKLIKCIILPIYVNIFIGRNGATNVLDEEHQPEIGDANVGNHFMEDFANTKTIVSRIKIVTTKVSKFFV